MRGSLRLHAVVRVRTLVKDIVRVKRVLGGDLGESVKTRIAAVHIVLLLRWLLCQTGSGMLTLLLLLLGRLRKVGLLHLRNVASRRQCSILLLLRKVLRLVVVGQRGPCGLLKQLLRMLRVANVLRLRRNSRVRLLLLRMMLRVGEGLAVGHRGVGRSCGRGLSGHGLKIGCFATRFGDSLNGEFRYLLESGGDDGGSGEPKMGLIGGVLGGARRKWREWAKLEADDDDTPLEQGFESRCEFLDF